LGFSPFSSICGQVIMVYDEHNEKLSAIVIGSFTASVTVPPEVNGTGKKKNLS